MIYSALKGDEQDEQSTLTASFLVLVATAIGTSLDAMAVGVSLAFLDVNIAVTALGIASTLYGQLGTHS
jgi:putative Mn2+ efflux pump MntP